MSSTNKDQFLDKALSRRRQEHRFRNLMVYEPLDATKISAGEQELIDFSSNDYLGLSKHPEVINRAQKYAKKYGAGATASRLISGTYSIHEKAEQKLADTFGRESALIFNSGFQANSTIISTLTNRHSLVLADKLSHNSLLQGSLASRATFRRFEHNSIADLEDHLRKASDENFDRIFIITESLFSMDGDRSNLQAIADLAEDHKAWLFVDDAHAIGVWGEQGRGLTAGISGIDMILGTCGKAFGGFGAFLLCSSKMRDFLINFCPGFIYTTALPPAVIGAIEAATEFIPKMETERKRLRRNILMMRDGIQKAGFGTGDSESQIIPIMVGEEQETLDLSVYLEQQGFLATAIRPPTVPKNSSRIRVTLSSTHTETEITEFLTALNNWKNG